MNVTADGPLKVTLAGCDLARMAPRGKSTMRCVSGRTLVLRVPRKLRGRRALSARVTVARRAPRTVRAPRRTVRISLRGLRRGRVRVQIVSRLAGGRRVTTVRHYRLCG